MPHLFPSSRSGFFLPVLVSCVLLVLRQFLLVVHVEGDQDVLVLDEVEHAGLRPNMLLHLAAVHTGVAGEIQEQGLLVRSASAMASSGVVEQDGRSLGAVLAGRSM